MQHIYQEQVIELSTLIKNGKISKSADFPSNHKQNNKTKHLRVSLKQINPCEFTYTQYIK